jgi:Papain family cysteine protease
MIPLRIRQALVPRAGAVLSCVVLLLAPAHTTCAATPQTAPLGAGATLESLQIGGITYQRVKVLSVNARTIMIAHSGGMASIRLRDLPLELQSRFGYNPAAAAKADAALQHANDLADKQRREEAQQGARLVAPESRIDDLLLQFGRRPDIRNQIDLRPRFIELGLGVKNQGRRPSCAVFAIVSALEYQYAELTGRAEKFSEEYLLWATRKALNRGGHLPEDSSPGQADLSDDADEGFSLDDVVLALRAYGILPLAAMPDVGYRKMTDIPEPSAELVDQARTHQRVFVHPLPGHNQAMRIDNVIHALNAGIPVAVGMRWPSFRTTRGGFLNMQLPLPGAAHAVTLIGYQNSSGNAEDTVFMFKNSWGPAWGEGGYGRATYRYLHNNLISAVLLEIQESKATL